MKTRKHGIVSAQRIKTTDSSLGKRSLKLGRLSAIAQSSDRNAMHLLVHLLLADAVVGVLVVVLVVVGVEVGLGQPLPLVQPVGPVRGRRVEAFRPRFQLDFQRL